MTKRLYYEDEMMREFDAVVVQCKPLGEDRWSVRLDQTAFFPEGGGQWADQGTLGTAHVLDVHEKNGEVEHYVDSPLQEGETVHGVLDWDRRFSVMQQHSGEHIFSGLVHQTYGYDNVGFHIGSEAVTMDFNGPLTWEQATAIEQRANEAIWKDLPIEHFLPDEEEQRHLEYRSKKEILKDLRIVQIPGVDTCACCGTHLATTGGVGQVKLIGLQRYKSGVRVSILCGGRALEYERGLLKEMDRIHILTSSKAGSCAEAVEAILEDRKQLQYRNEQLAGKVFEALAGNEWSKAVRVVYCPELSPEGTAKAAGRLAEGAEIALLVSGEGDLLRFALSSQKRDIRNLTKAFCQAFGGKGGGKPDMTQGRFQATEPDVLRKWLEENLE